MGQRGISLKRAKALLAKQRIREQESRDAAKLLAAIKRFRVRKSDKGNLVFIGINGQRDAKAKGRKGFLVYVTRKGKKQPVKDFTGRNKAASIPKPKRFRNLNLDSARKKKTAFKAFLRANSRTYGTGKAFFKSSIKKQTKERSLRFSKDSRLVKRLTDDITKALRSRRARRVFLISIMAVLAHGNSKTTIETTAKIERQDFASIDKFGVREFVLRKLYAFLAQAAASRGLVTFGSAQHVARLKENEGLPREEWTKDSLAWQGRDLETARIIAFEYRIDELTA